MDEIATRHERGLVHAAAGFAACNHERALHQRQVIQQRLHDARCQCEQQVNKNRIEFAGEDDFARMII